MTNLVNLMFYDGDDKEKPASVDDERIDFAEFGEDIFESEELTDTVYRVFMDMMAQGFQSQPGQTEQEFHISDIGLIYLIGPYLPCVKRVSFTQDIDLKSDGLPGIRVVAFSRPSKHGTDRSSSINLIRPVNKFPPEVYGLSECVGKYKLVSMWKKDGNKRHGDRLNGELLEGTTFYFGVTSSGRLISPLYKRYTDFQRAQWHAASRVFPALTANAWADSRYLWIAETHETWSTKCDLKLRLGLSVEHIKSLFYARKMPLTETGRKRPILHWVRAHQRRLKDGIDIDIRPHLRGIIELEMDSLRFRITQPDKDALHRSDIRTVREAYDLYATK